MTSAAQKEREAREAASGGAGALHLIKLCVGAESVEDLTVWQALRAQERTARGEDARPCHVTRMSPKRADELLDGGSLYWIIKGVTRCRQRILAIEQVEDAEGIVRCKLVLDPEIRPVAAQPRRPFQGWRYLAGADAPRDLGWSSSGDGEDAIPRELEEALAAYGVL